jgi:hypothetical protein
VGATGRTPRRPAAGMGSLIGSAVFQTWATHGWQELIDAALAAT